VSFGSKDTGSGFNYYHKDWAGADGKYSLVNGVRVVNEHDYVMHEYYHSASPDSQTGLNYTNVDVIPSRTFPGHKAVQLQNKIVAKVKEHEFSLGKFVAEGRQTVGMTVEAIKTIANALHALKHGDLPSAARALRITDHRSALHPKDIAGRWLELQYGWLPLLTDVSEACKAYEALTAPPRRDTVKATTVSRVSYEGSASPTNWKGHGDDQIIRRIIYRMVESVPVARSLGLEDPLGIAWEIIPYSFVLDWFIPIGTYLENLSVIPTLTGKSITTEVRLLNCKAEVLNQTYYKGCTASFSYKSVTRTVANGLPLASPSFKSVDEAMSPRHIWNALALATQKVNSPGLSSLGGLTPSRRR